MLTDIWEWICDNVLGIVMMLFIICVSAVIIFALIEAMPQLDEGVIVDKEYTPPGSRIAMVYTGKFMVPVRQSYPAKWQIQVRGVTDDGEKRIEWWTVTQEEWMRRGRMGSLSFICWTRHSFSKPFGINC